MVFSGSSRLRLKNSVDHEKSVGFFNEPMILMLISVASSIVMINAVNWQASTESVEIDEKSAFNIRNNVIALNDRNSMQIAIAG